MYEVPISQSGTLPRDTIATGEHNGTQGSLTLEKRYQTPNTDLHTSALIPGPIYMNTQSGESGDVHAVNQQCQYSLDKTTHVHGENNETFDNERFSEERVVTDESCGQDNNTTQQQIQHHFHE